MQCVICSGLDLACKQPMLYLVLAKRHKKAWIILKANENAINEQKKMSPGSITSGEAIAFLPK